MNIEKIVVLGAGTMGRGIAQLSAMAGFQTVLFDIEPSSLPIALESITNNLDEAVRRSKISSDERDAALQRIETTQLFGELTGEVIIEAVVERLDIKLEAFMQIARINPPTTILATNTSSIPITQLAAQLPNPERVVGMHFFNPAHLMKLVEVVAGAVTSAEVINTIQELSILMGKTPVLVRDAPGFIVNRVARHFYVEALQLLEENVAPLTTIDDLAEANGFRMGPFRLMDLIGVDVNFSVTQSIYEILSPRSPFPTQPHPATKGGSRPPRAQNGQRFLLLLMQINGLVRGYILFAAALFIVLVANSCANKVAPSSGPKDIAPPQVVRAIPALGSTNVRPETVVIAFDEYVQPIQNAGTHCGVALFGATARVPARRAKPCTSTSTSRWIATPPTPSTSERR